MSTKAPPTKTTVSFKVYLKDKKQVKKLVRELLKQKGYKLYGNKETKIKDKGYKVEGERETEKV